ncbi:MAG: PD-(D/E)XK nuclease family protein [Eubacteriales bacterium]
MVHFIYGDPGTGKTEYILRKIEKDAENKQAALLIVPEQMTVEAERELVRRLPPSAQLYVEAVNFSRLANKIFRMYGGLAYNFASTAFQKLTMLRALRQVSGTLSEYHSTGTDDISLASSMLSTYKELSASGISLESLDGLIATMGDTTLAGKIKDITAVCSVYNYLIGEKYTDTNNELSRLDSILKTVKCFDNTNLYFDGFTSYTGIEHNIIRSLLTQSSTVTFSVPLPEPTSKGIDTVSIRRSSDRLRRDCASLGLRSETTCLSLNMRTSIPELSELSRHLWAIDRAPVASSVTQNAVKLIRAADVYDECEIAASEIRELIESGYRYKDVAIIARDVDKYRGIIEPALDNAELSYFVSEKTDPSLCPVSKLILSALRIANYGWRRSDVVAHLKSGLCGIDARDCDIFESYTAKWNINGKKFTADEPWNMNPDGYTTERTERGALILETANKVKGLLVGRLKTYISELKSAETYSELCIATVKYLEELSVKDTLLSISSKYISKGKLKEAGEYARMYDVVLDCLDCVCDALSEEAPELSFFATAINTALSESELGSIPTSRDVITIGSANMLRVGNIKCAIILGACDGEFPANAQSSGLLTDSDRDYLTNHELPISGDRESKASDELFYFRRAVSVPSEKLIVFTRADSEPSVAFTRVRGMLGNIKVYETSDMLIQRLKTRKSASEYVHMLKGTEIGEALARELEQNDGSKLQEISAVNDVIAKESINKIIGKDLRLSQSKIESFVNCKFAYTCKYFLKLDDGRPAQFAYNNIGTFVHHVLEKFLLKVFITDNGAYPDKEEREIIVTDIIGDYISRLLPDKPANNARLNHLFDRLKATSLLLIDDLLNEFDDSDFKPEFFELKIGTEDVPSIRFSLSDGRRLTISGVVDRVDVFRANDKAYLRVVDYKTGNKTFSISDISEGLNLQLLLYIFSLVQQKESAFAKSLGATPAIGGITYISAPQAKVKSARFSSESEAYRSAVNEIKRSGLIVDDESIIHATTHSGNSRYLMSTSRKSSNISAAALEQLYMQVCDVLTDIGNAIASGEANARPKPGTKACTYCEYAKICRASKKDN